jgi:hypothetical protein
MRTVIPIFILTIFTIISCNTPTDQNKNGVTLPKESEEIKKYDAVTLIDDYAENNLSAVEKIKGKKIIVAGIIHKIGKNNYDQVYVEFKGTDDEHGLRCYFNDTLPILDKEKIFQLRKGQNITISGKYGGTLILMGIYLQHCQIIDK